MSALSLVLPLALIGDSPWLEAGLLALLVLVPLVVLGTQVLKSLRSIERRLDGLEHLSAIEERLRGLAIRGDGEGDPGQGLDLRRMEHVLVDIRDGNRRLDERLLTLLDSRRPTREALEGGAQASAHAVGSVTPVAERVITRLIAMGYERVEVLTSGEALATLADEDGAVLVEARRGGGLHKGRVHLKDGAIAEVELRSTYDAFP